MNTSKRIRRRAVSASRSILPSGSVSASTALLRNHGLLSMSHDVTRDGEKTIFSVKIEKCYLSEKYE